jgi:hypothetical protein
VCVRVCVWLWVYLDDKFCCVRFDQCNPILHYISHYKREGSIYNCALHTSNANTDISPRKKKVCGGLLPVSSTTVTFYFVLQGYTGFFFCPFALFLLLIIKKIKNVLPCCKTWIISGIINSRYLILLTTFNTAKYFSIITPFYSFSRLTCLWQYPLVTRILSPWKLSTYWSILRPQLHYVCCTFNWIVNQLLKFVSFQLYSSVTFMKFITNISY